MEFNYKKIKGTDGKTYLRISLVYDQRTWSEDCRMYWGGFFWRKPFAEASICRRILKAIT
jgi:hypothetical protein